MEEARQVTLEIIETLKEKRMDARSWTKIRNFIDTQYEIEKSKSKLKCDDKNALINQINGQIW